VRVQFPNPGKVVPRSGTVNAGEVTVWGAELDTSWLPTERWLLNLSLAFNDGEYDDLVLAEVQTSGAPLSRSELVKAGNLQGDFSGNETPGTPKLAGSLLGRYTAPLTADLDWYLQSVVTYQDERYADTANLVTLDSYWLANAQAGIEKEQWFVSLFVDNLFDDDTVRYAQEFIDQSQGFQGPNPANGAPTTYLPQPRTVGIRFSYGTR
jgi:outer membrane receptor protein involved in Fe transport